MSYGHDNDQAFSGRIPLPSPHQGLEVLDQQKQVGRIGQSGLEFPRLVPLPGRAFTAESRIPLFCMVFEHELTPLAAAQTEVVHRVSFTGPLSLLLAPLMTRRLNSGLPVTLARLKARAEGVGARISSQSGQ